MVIIQSFWTGSPLTDMESMAIRSHILQGHQYHLYSYAPIEGVPQGVKLMDADAICPQKEVFPYRVGAGKGSFSAFSNVFRYKLLLQRGGWWVDTDVVCLKPFHFEEDYVFASERIPKQDKIHPTTCVIKCPAGSGIMEYCSNYCSKVDRDTLEWGTIGPSLLKRAVSLCCLDRYVVLPDIFCPIDWFDLSKLFSDVDVDAHAVHLWNEMWRRKGLDKNIQAPNTLYGRLRDAFLLQ